MKNKIEQNSDKALYKSDFEAFTQCIETQKIALSMPLSYAKTND